MVIKNDALKLDEITFGNCVGKSSANLLNFTSDSMNQVLLMLDFLVVEEFCSRIFVRLVGDFQIEKFNIQMMFVNRCSLRSQLKKM